MAVPLILPTIHNTLGVLFVTVILTVALYAAGMLQGYLYFNTYRKTDPWAIQLLVAFCLLADTIQQGLICEAIYMYAVTEHDNPMAMLIIYKTIIVELYFGGILAFVVQTFYCWRILKLSKSWLLFGFIWAISWACVITLFIFASRVIQFATLPDLQKETDMATFTNVFGAVCDVFITLGMIILLQRAKKEAFRKTTDMLNRAIIFTFNTGIPTSMCAIASITCLHVIPNTFFYMALYLIMDRLYTNSLLVSLNSRAYIRAGALTHYDEESIMDTIEVSGRSGYSGSTGPRKPQKHHGRNNHNDGLFSEIAFKAKTNTDTEGVLSIGTTTERATFSDEGKRQLDRSDTESYGMHPVPSAF